MFGCLKSLVLLATPLFPWLVASFVLAGLGLLVCYEFLELNKGYFRVKSEPDKGSTFTISLPVKE